jgi:hypothetical protein
MPRFRANGVAELELGRDSRRSKVLCLVEKYWLRILQVNKEQLVFEKCLFLVVATMGF